jgi:hypothetical protein
MMVCWRRALTHFAPIGGHALNSSIPPCLTSDNPAYVNQAVLDRTGLTLMPVNGSNRTVFPAGARQVCQGGAAPALHRGRHRRPAPADRAAWRQPLRWLSGGRAGASPRTAGLRGSRPTSPTCVGDADAAMGRQGHCTRKTCAFVEEQGNDRSLSSCTITSLVVTCPLRSLPHEAGVWERWFLPVTMPLAVCLRLLRPALLILREWLSGEALVPSGGARPRLCQYDGVWAPEAHTPRRRCVWYAICSHHG